MSEVIAPQYNAHPETGTYLVLKYWYGLEGTSNRNGPGLSPEEPPEKQHHGFDEDANGLWSLYGKEAKSHDEARIETLKGDMDGVLIFVCACVFLLCPDLHAALIPGRFILRCYHCVRRAKAPGFESEPRRPVSLLPESNRSHA